MGNLFNLDSPVMRFLSRMADLIILNLMFLVCCIPIVTIGTSFTALYSVTLKMVKNEESYIFKGFIKAFKENFKQSTIMWLIMLAIGILLYVDFRAAAYLSKELEKIFRMILVMFTSFYTIILLYLFPYLARFENTIKNSFKNAFLISILNLPWTFIIVILSIGSGFVTFLTGKTIVYGILIWFLIGFSFIAYLNSMLFRKIFVKYEPGAEDQSAEIK